MRARPSFRDLPPSDPSGSGGDRSVAVSRTRRRAVAVLVAAIVLGQLYDTAVDGDHWPFSSYPMFARPRETTLRVRRLHGVTAAGDEVPIVVPRDLPPFHEARLMTAFKRLGRRPDRDARLTASLDAALALYDDGRRAGVHHGGALRGMRLYLVSFAFDPRAANRDEPDERRLLAETHR
jgi:hypothetical protein